MTTDMNDPQEIAKALIETAKSGNDALLDLSGMGLTSIPKEIGQLSGLTMLLLNDNNLTAFPPEILGLSMLEVLYLEDNQIVEIPANAVIEKLPALQIFSRHKNPLARKYPEIKQFLYENGVTAAGGKFITRNGQKVACYGVWDDYSNAECVFEDETFDGTWADGADNFTQVVEELTAYAVSKGTVLVEITAE